MYIDTQRILEESAVVARAIRRHERVAELTGRPDEAQAMHWLGHGVAELAYRLGETNSNCPHPRPTHTSSLEASLASLAQI